LNQNGNAVAVEDQKAEGTEHQEPTGNERYLRDKRSMRILMGDQEDQKDIDERTHKDADTGLRYPVLHEPVEKSRAKQIGPPSIRPGVPQKRLELAPC